MKHEEVIYAYHALVQRACKIVAGAPYWSSVEPEFAILALAGELATLTWPVLDNDGWDSYSIGTKASEFRTSLLYLADDELKNWKAEQLRAYKKQERERKAAAAEAHAAAREAHERATLAELKAKYEPRPMPVAPQDPPPGHPSRKAAKE